MTMLEVTRVTIQYIRVYLYVHSKAEASLIYSVSIGKQGKTKKTGTEDMVQEIDRISRVTIQLTQSVRAVGRHCKMSNNSDIAGR